MEQLRILSKMDARYMEVFRVLLVRKSAATLIPELYDIFGLDAIMKFLDIFGGTTINVPDRTLLTDLVRDADIYLRLSAGEKIRELAVLYSLHDKQVQEIFDQVKLDIQNFESS